MGNTATFNIRLPEELKDRAMHVLEQAGISASDAVRDLFYELEETQKVPEFILQRRAKGDSRDAMAHKRNLMRSMVGIIPSDIEIDAIKRERLENKCRPGVRA